MHASKITGCWNGRREASAGYTTDVFFREAMRWMRSEAQARLKSAAFDRTLKVAPTDIHVKFRVASRPASSTTASQYCSHSASSSSRA